VFSLDNFKIVNKHRLEIIDNKSKTTIQISMQKFLKLRRQIC